jgi:glyoxylase-like metal-dependent hydrolase (beta-lactamase superfamily II)
MRKTALLLSLLLLAIVAVTVSQRFRLLLWFFGDGQPPALLEPADEGPGPRWMDDYFIVQVIDPQTFAIGEPRYHQQNFNYLIAGTERAILFDAGPGQRDIRPIAEALTGLPITFVPSHFHFDHVGNEITFERVAVADLPHLRDRAEGDRLQLEWYEHLGSAEGYAAPALQVDVWLQLGAVIDLGGRGLRVLFTPGHTDDSISLLDEAAGLLFSGDFIYPGPLYAFLPNSSLGDYLQGTHTVLAAAADARVFGAHRDAPPGAPEQSLADVRDLKQALEAIRAGTLDGQGFYPVTYLVSPTMQLSAEPAWLQDWEVRYPEYGPRNSTERN